MAVPTAIEDAGKLSKRMIEISAGPVGRGPFEGSEVRAYSIDQGPMMNGEGKQIPLASPPAETRYDVVRFDAQGTPLPLSKGLTEVEVRKAFQKWSPTFDVRTNPGFRAIPIVVATEKMPSLPKGFDGPRQPLVFVPGRQRDVYGKRVLGAKEICERRGLRLPLPAEAARAAGGPQQFLHSSSDGTLNRLAIHSCARDQSHKRGENCPQTTRDVGAQAEKGVYVSWPQSDGTMAEYFDGNGNVWIWAYENGAYYICGGSWYVNDPEGLGAGYCFEYNPEGFYYDFGVRCASS